MEIVRAYEPSQLVNSLVKVLSSFWICISYSVIAAPLVVGCVQAILTLVPERDVVRVLIVEGIAEGVCVDTVEYGEDP